MRFSLLFILSLASCSNARAPEWTRPTTAMNFEWQIDECAAASREHWTERGARDACDKIEPAVWQLFQKKLRTSVTIGPMAYGIDCERGLRAMRSGFFERHRALITTFCNEKNRNGLWPDAFW